MPRSPRIHAKDLLYHVYARGNNRELIFFEESNMLRFLKNLEKYQEKFHFTTYAYCLMPNHFHLLIQVQNIALSKIMQSLLTAYTMYVNKKYNHVGHVFQGRYQAILVDMETYLLEATRYIHLNPVRAGLVERPQDYFWSSYPAYIQTHQSSSIVKPANILSMYSDDSIKAIVLFGEFTEAGLTSSFDPLKDHMRDILGNSAFHQRLTKVLKGVRP